MKIHFEVWMNFDDETMIMMFFEMMIRKMTMQQKNFLIIFLIQIIMIIF